MTDPARNIDIMGIVNVNNDSYFADSRCPSADSAVERIGEMLHEGASIIDLGACSTRPGAAVIGAEEEWMRLEPVLSAIRKTFPEVRLSIDTFHASVVRKAYELVGDFIVNDISAGEDDPLMLPTVGKLGLEYIAMHKRGTPETMQEMTGYDSVTEDIMRYFESFSERAAENGIRRWILDPGFGFAKTIDQNYQMLRELSGFRGLRCADCTSPRILVGISRKSMIYKKFGISPEESLPQTQVLHFAALQRGADILRVHDVAEACRTVDLYRTMTL